MLEERMDYRIIISILVCNYLLFSVDSSTTVEVAVKQPRYCQWEPSYVANRQTCVNKICSSGKGFIHAIQKKFLCSEEHERKGKAKVGIRNEEGGDTCVCTHPDDETIVCNLKIIRESRTVEQCIKTCEKIFVLSFIENGVRKAYCEEASSIELHNLEAEVQGGVTQTQNTRGIYRSRLCMCGIDLPERKISYENRDYKNGKKYQIPSPLLPNLCQMERFLVSKAKHCERKCDEIFAFVNSKRQLICYDERKPAEMISSVDEECQCGIIINKKKKIERRLPCYPENKHSLITAADCTKKCQKNVYAYVFDWASHRVTYCDSRKEPPVGYVGLEFQIEKGTPRTLTTYEYPCSCGTSDPITNENVSLSRAGNRHNSLPRTRPILKKATDQRNTPSLFESGLRERISQINIQKSPGTSSGTRTFSETGITRNSDNIASSHLAATNQILLQKQREFGNVSFSRLVTKQGTRPELNREDVYFQRNNPNSNSIADCSQPPINKQNIRNVSDSQAATNTIISKEPNKNASTVITPATKRNREIDRESPNREIKTNLHLNAGPSQTATNEISKRNVFGNINLSGLIKKPRTSLQESNGNGNSSHTTSNQISSLHPICIINSSEATAHQRPNSNRGTSSLRVAPNQTSIIGNIYSSGVSEQKRVTSNSTKNATSSLIPDPICGQKSFEGAAATSNQAAPNRRFAKNSNIPASSSNDIISNLNIDVEGCDTCEEIWDDPFASSPIFLPFGMRVTDVLSIEDIPIISTFDDIVPVDDVNSPSHFDLLLQNERRSLSERNSFANNSSHDPTVRNINKSGDDNILFGDTLMGMSPVRHKVRSDELINSPSSLGAQSPEIVPSDYAPVADLFFKINFLKRNLS